MMQPEINSQKPAWLEALLTERFFIACGKHATLRKNEQNIFCIDCTKSICQQHCLSSHGNHKLLQVRRYVYHNVIQLDDIQKIIDCDLIQIYTTNSAPVVFLNQRPKAQRKGAENFCETCERALQESFRYCSVACKVDSMVKRGKDLGITLRQCNSVDFSISPARTSKDDLKQELSPNSIFEGLYSTSSSSDNTVSSFLPIKKRRTRTSRKQPTLGVACCPSPGRKRPRKGKPCRSAL